MPLPPCIAPGCCLESLHPSVLYPCVCLSAETSKTAVLGAKAAHSLEPGSFGAIHPPLPPPSFPAHHSRLASCSSLLPEIPHPRPVLHRGCGESPGCVQSINCYCCNNRSVSREMPERAAKIERPVCQPGRRLRSQESNCSTQKQPVSDFPSTARKNPQCLFNDNKIKKKQPYSLPMLTRNAESRGRCKIRCS